MVKEGWKDYKMIKNARVWLIPKFCLKILLGLDRCGMGFGGNEDLGFGKARSLPGNLVSILRVFRFGKGWVTLTTFFGN